MGEEKRGSTGIRAGQNSGFSRVRDVRIEGFDNGYVDDGIGNSLENATLVGPGTKKPALAEPWHKRPIGMIVMKVALTAAGILTGAALAYFGLR